ncbi:hypothetical protein CALCODRAFT_489206, partial [Calocera cornea HHB12733]
MSLSPAATPRTTPDPSSGGVVARNDPALAAFNPLKYFLDDLSLPEEGRLGSAGEGLMAQRCAALRDEAVEFFKEVGKNGTWRSRAYSLVEAPIPPPTGGHVLDAIRLRQALYGAACKYRAAMVAPELVPRHDGQKYPRRLKNSELVLRHPDVTPATRAHYKRYPELTNNFFDVVENFLAGCINMGKTEQLSSPKGKPMAEAAAHMSNALCNTAGNMSSLGNILMVCSLLSTSLEYDSHGGPLVPIFMQKNTWGRKKPPTRTDIFRPIFLAACYSPIALLVDFPLQWEPLPLHPLID